MTQKASFFETPQIYFPKLYTAVSQKYKHVELTGQQAAAEGYSFRKNGTA